MMVRYCTSFLLLFFCCDALYAQDIRRCVLSDGSVVVTDKVCEAGSVEKTALPEPVLRTPGLNRRTAIPAPPSCNASVDDLVYSVRIAIDMHDINQLAKHYHWPGVSDAQAEALMNRLEKLVNQPTLDIQLQYPQVQDESNADFDYQYSELPAELPPRTPYGLKVLQYASSTDDTMRSTEFRLQRHFNCWWIRY